MELELRAHQPLPDTSVSLGATEMKSESRDPLTSPQSEDTEDIAKVKECLAHIFRGGGLAKSEDDDTQWLPLEKIIFVEGSLRGINVEKLSDESFQAKGRLYFAILREHKLDELFPLEEKLDDENSKTNLTHDKNAYHRYTDFVLRKNDEKNDEQKDEQNEEQNNQPINQQNEEQNDEKKDEEKDEVKDPWLNGDVGYQVSCFYALQECLSPSKAKFNVEQNQQLKAQLRKFQDMFRFSNWIRVVNSTSTDREWHVHPLEIKLCGKGSWEPTEFMETFMKDHKKYVVLRHQVDFDMTFREDFELEAFPFDFQDLMLQFESTKKNYYFSPGFRRGPYFSCDAKKFPFQSLRFECLEMYFGRREASRARPRKLLRNYVHINLKVSRQYQTYLYDIYVPVIFLSVASLIPIHDPTRQEADTLAYTIGLILALLLFLQTLQDSLPKTPYFTHASRFLFTATVSIFGVLIRLGFGPFRVTRSEERSWIIGGCVLFGMQMVYTVALWIRERSFLRQWRQEESLKVVNERQGCCNTLYKPRVNSYNFMGDGQEQRPLLSDVVQPELFEVDGETVLNVDVRDMFGQELEQRDAGDERGGVYFSQRCWFGEKDNTRRFYFVFHSFLWIFDALFPLELLPASCVPCREESARRTRPVID